MDLIKIGLIIKEYRVKRSINQKNFAKKIGITQSYLSLMEHGKKKPSLPMLNKICSELLIPLEALLFLSMDNKNIEQSKRQEFDIMKPIIDKMINQLFTY